MRERDRQSYEQDADVGGEAALDPGKQSLTDQLGKSRRTISSVPGRSMRTDGIAIQRKANGRKGGAKGDAIKAAHKSTGIPLPADMRVRLQQSLGADLSSVRVHTGPESHEAAESVGAEAYTLGQNIHFAAGKYDPASQAGQSLIAHEVAHTVQQHGAAEVEHEELAVSSPGDAHEGQAESFAQSFVAGHAATVAPVSKASVARAIARRAQDDAAEPKAEAQPKDAPPKPDSAGKDEVGAGDPAINRVGQTPDDGEDYGVGKAHNSEAGKQEIAGHGTGMPEKGGADELGAGEVKPEAGGPNGAPGDGGVMTPEVSASIVGAQTETHEAIAQSQVESATYKAGMKTEQDRFDAEQHATMLEQLKAMTPADKRGTLKEMGYDDKSIKKLKDSEIDGIITGQIETQQRKTKIMGMDPDELKALSADKKIQYLCDLGIDRGDLDKVGQGRATKLFDDIMAVAHVPGQHKVEIQIKGGWFTSKKWVVTVKCDAENNTDVEAQKEGGFLSKLWGWIKAAIPIILTVLAPLTAGASLIVLAVYQTAMAIKNGDWLGAVIGAAGAIVGVGAFLAAKGALGAATTFAKIASIATKAKNVAQAAQAALLASKAKNAGSLLGALASGAASFASFASNAADKFAQTMTKWSEKLKKWSAIIGGGEKVAKGIKTGDPIGAVGGAFDTASAAVGANSDAAKNLGRASNITSLVNTGRRALASKPPDYGSVADAALGIAGQLKKDQRLEDATRIVAAATRLKAAWDERETNPGALAEAAFGVAASIQVAKYDAVHKDDNASPEDKAATEAGRTELMNRYERAGRVSQLAGALLTATTAKPRPNYLGALDAVTGLVAEFKKDDRLDAAAALTGKLDAWTQAVNSKDEQAILAAGTELGEAINGLRDSITEARAKAKAAAEAKLAPGETLPDTGGDAALPPGPAPLDPLAPLPSTQIGTGMADFPAVVDPAPIPLGTTSGRASTPEANYTVVPGDTLSGIGSRFSVKVDLLRSLNPQLVNNVIYVGQRLSVPGADTLLTPSVTTDETFKVDPAAVAGQRALAIRSAQLNVKTVNDQISTWNKQSSLGADFYVYVEELRKEVDFLDRMTDQPSSTAAGINGQNNSVNRQFLGVRTLWEQRMGHRGTAIDVAVVAATIIRDGAGVIISALGSKLASAGYQGVITAIDEYAQGGSGKAIAIRSALAAIIEVAPDASGKLASAVNEGMREVANAVNDFMAELAREPDMSDQKRRDLERKYLAKIPTMFGMGAVKGANGGAEEALKTLSQRLKAVMDEGLFELFKTAADKAIDAAAEHAAGEHGGG